MTIYIVKVREVTETDYYFDASDIGDAAEQYHAAFPHLYQSSPECSIEDIDIRPAYKDEIEKAGL